MLSILTAALAADVTLSPGDDVASLTAALQPGDEVIFSAGTYTLPGSVTWTGLGTAEQPITLRGEGEVVLELTAGGTAVYVTESTFLTLEGLTIRAAATYAERFTGLQINASTDVRVSNVEIGPVGGTGLYLSGDNARITVSDVQIHTTADGHGVYVGCWDAACWTQDSTFERLWIHDIGDDGYGFELEPGCQNVTLRDSVIYRVGGWGVVTGSTEQGAPNLIESNAVWETTQGGMYVGGSARVRNNVVFNSASYGVRLTDDGRGTLKDVAFTFNTVADTASVAVDVSSWAGKTGMVLANNVIANPIGRAVTFGNAGWDDTVYISGNVVTGFIDGFDALTYVGADTPFLPGGGWYDFTDVEAWDFYPADGGAMIDAADPSSATWIPETDFNGAGRDGTAPDAGAYEFEGAGNPGWGLREGFKDVAAYAPRAAEVQGGCCKDADESSAEGAAFFLGLAALGLRRRRASAG